MKFQVLLFLLCATHWSTAQVTQNNVVFPDSFAVSEQVFGLPVEDPFRGFEQSDHPLVQSWMQRKNEQAVQSLQQIAGYEDLKDEMTALRTSSNVRSLVPVENDGVVYSLRTVNDTGLHQIVSFDSPSSEGKVLFSTANLNEHDSTFYTIYGFEPSPDNRYLAIQMYPDGNDMMEIRILDIAQDKLLDEVIDASISYFPSWLPDGQSFFYTQLSLPEDSSDYFDNVRVKLHRIGSPQSEDIVILEPGSRSEIVNQPGDFPVFQVVEGGKYALCSVAHGISQYITYYQVPLLAVEQQSNEGQWITLATVEDQVSEAVSDRQHLYTLHHHDNPGGTIHQRLLADPEASSSVFAPQEGYINAMKIVGGKLYVEHIVDGLSQIVQVSIDGQRVLPLPFSGDVDLSADGFLSSGSEQWLFFGLSNWTHAYGIYAYLPEQDTVIRTTIRPAGPYDLPKDLTVEEVLVPSHDGELVPLSIIYQSSLERDGTNPTILEAYGAYGQSLESYFSVEMLAWYRRGGILAYAHVRGGGEKGLAWHDAGRKSSKPNSWKDLIACTEYLIDNKYTSSQKLGVRGGSAGGIAVGRAITERPELYGAAVLEYALLNPTRLDQTPDAVVQEDEFGSPADSTDFQHLYQMDTYLHVKEGMKYPAVLLTAGKEDSRIPIWEPAKVAARLERDRGNKRPTLFRTYDGGHGTGDTEEAISNLVDPIAFFLWQLGHPEHGAQP